MAQPLSIENIFGNNPWGITGGSDTPRATVPPTPIESVDGSIYGDVPGNSPPATSFNSPTESLHAATQSNEWTFNGMTFDSLDAAAAFAAEQSNIPAYIRDWVLVCFATYAQRDHAATFNMLGHKITEHRALAREETKVYARKIFDLDERLSRMEQDRLRLGLKVSELQAENRRRSEETMELKRQVEVLANNDQVFQQAVKFLKDENQDLRNQINALRTAGISPPVPRFTAPTPQPTQPLPPVFPPPPPPGPPMPPFPPAPPAPVAPQQPVQPTSNDKKPKIPDPPKFAGKDKGSKLTLDQWLQKMNIWIRYQGFVQDNSKIIAALMFLEEGPLSYMSEYSQRASDGRDLGTWAEFVARLSTGYRDYSPEKTARAKLEEHCAKKHATLTAFAEQFRLHAHKSGYSDAELIARIERHLSQQIRGHMITLKTIDPTRIPTAWEGYLEFVLGQEAEFRTARDPSQSTSHTNVSTPAKDPNAMDIDAVRQSPQQQDLTQEQHTWWEKKLCFRCGKHPYVKGEKCRNPKHKGWFKLPQPNTSPKSNTVRVVDPETATPSASATTPTATPNHTADQLRTMLQEAEEREKQETASVVQETPSIENFEDSDFQHRLV